MARDEETRDVPIVKHDTLRPGPERVRVLRTFCPWRARSLELATCASCARLRELPDDPEAAEAHITCAVPSDESARSLEEADPETFAALAGGIAVGAAMSSRAVCVRPDTPLAEVFAQDQHVVWPVVDDEGRLLGVLWRPDVAPAPLREALALAARAGYPMRGIVAEQMDTHHSVLHESSPLTEALRALTVDHARMLPVVADGGFVVGTISDLDLLSWFGRARRSLLR